MPPPQKKNTWTLRRQNFLPKGPGGRNFRQKAQKTLPARKNAETQQTLRHAETCFREIPPISGRIPPISRRNPPISCCLFCTELDFEKNAARETKNAANSKKAPFSKKAETSADLGGPGIYIYMYISRFFMPPQILQVLPKSTPSTLSNQKAQKVCPPPPPHFLNLLQVPPTSSPICLPLRSPSQTRV